MSERVNANPDAYRFNEELLELRAKLATARHDALREALRAVEAQAKIWKAGRTDNRDNGNPADCVKAIRELISKG